MEKIVAVKGMNDILPSESYKWLKLESIIREWLECYGYNNIRTPIVEDTKLFKRSIGEVTDIVEKEMYSFKDNLNGDELTLRPEGTAGTIRAVVEHNLLYNNTQKLWYIGQMFRHEKPQKGRYRQFHQLGVEALGFQTPDVDAEIILMLSDLFKRLNIQNLELQINCLGSKEERAIHRQHLIEYFEKHMDILDEDAKRRLYTNPLRILDTKNSKIFDLVENAPKLIDYLGDESKTHYSNWKMYLDGLGIKYVENNRLVRGLDYYNLSVFEWVSSNLGSQGTVAAGGRYDGLIAQLGGKDNYAIGFAIGLERLLLELEHANKDFTPTVYDVYVANMGNETELYTLQVSQKLRQMGFSVIQNFGNNSFKSQFKKANALGVTYTIVIGEEELKNNTVIVKNMQTQSQEVVQFDSLSIDKE